MSHTRGGRRLVLWRHGLTDWNVAGKVQGQTDTDLNEIGRQQARDAALRLASLQPSRIVSSDLRRARDTAQALSDVSGVDVEFDERLREMNFGAREGMTWQQSWQELPEGMKAWVSGDESKIPGSETHWDAGQRAAAALRDIVETMPEDDLVVVAAHGAILRTGACAFLGFPRESWMLFSGLSNCCWIVLEQANPRHNSKWRLIEWNAGNLPEPIVSDEDHPGFEPDGTIE